jgi:hypothetical protein
LDTQCLGGGCDAAALRFHRGRELCSAAGIELLAGGREPELYGHVDEAFDKRVLDILASGRGSKLAQFTPDDLMQSGNGELVNWVITAGICGDVKCQVLDYIRLWHIGLGYLYWDV